MPVRIYSDFPEKEFAKANYFSLFKKNKELHQTDLKIELLK